jgi:hypothetical protein
MNRKHAVDTVETLDFLRDIVANVPDPSAGGTIDIEAANAEKKSRKGKAASGEGAPRKRRKKAAVNTAIGESVIMQQEPMEDVSPSIGRSGVVDEDYEE